MAQVKKNSAKEKLIDNVTTPRETKGVGRAKDFAGKSQCSKAIHTQ